MNNTLNKTADWTVRYIYLPLGVAAIVNGYWYSMALGTFMLVVFSWRIQKETNHDK